jgi:hypothetical protein
MIKRKVAYHHAGCYTTHQASQACYIVPCRIHVLNHAIHVRMYVCKEQKIKNHVLCKLELGLKPTPNFF